MGTRFDHVIVGGGTAGCVLANRLSRDPARRVLLLEAGPRDRSPLIHVPIGFGALYRHRRLNWNRLSEPEPALNGRAVEQPLGKVLGGTSAINGMMYMRGQREDFDHWAALGNRGWSYAEVLPYFKRSECHEQGESEYHGGHGEWHVGSVRYRSPLAEAFIEAALAAGIPANDDINGARQCGISSTPVNQRNGRRDSAATAFLAPARGRPNLTVRTGAHVTRIVFAGDRATGVRYRRGKRTLEALAGSEVLLCGGTFHSPQLLQLSGVGPRRLLEKHGIEVVHDLPGVGENLQDHVAVDVVHECTAPVTLLDDFKPHRLVGHLLLYLLRRRGLLTFHGSLVGGFCHTSGDHSRRPNCQLAFFPAAAVREGGSSGSIRMRRGMTGMPIALRPDARGSVRIRSADLADPPRIRHGFLESARDRQELIEAVKLQRHLFAQPPLDRYRGPELAPGPEVRSDREILDHVRATARGCYHPVGTCRMGHDEMAVVDERLRIRGLVGLRVVDGSVMPTITSGNTCAPIVMIAEKAADLVLEDGP